MKRDNLDVFLFVGPGVQIIGFVEEQAPKEVILAYPAKIFLEANGVVAFNPVEFFPLKGPVTLSRDMWRMWGRPDPSVVSMYREKYVKRVDDVTADPSPTTVQS